MIGIRSGNQGRLEGDQSKSRDGKELLNILRSLERVVHLFLNEGSSRGATHRQNQSYGEIEKDPRLDRPCGWLGRIDNPDIAGLQASRNSGFSQPLQQAFI